MVLARMDQNAQTFKSMNANLRQVSHNAVINEDEVSTGAIRMKRSKKEAQVVVEFTAPEPKGVALSGTKAEMYYPKLVGIPPVIYFTERSYYRDSLS